MGRSPGVGNDNPFLPGKFCGQRSLAGCSPGGCKQSDRTEHVCTHARTCTHTEPINNVVIVSGEQQRDPATCIHVSILPQTPFPSRLPHNIPGLYSRSSLAIHFKYSSVYMSIQNSLTLLSPILLPGNHKFKSNF